MKKVYSKPAVEVVDVTINSIMLEMSVFDQTVEGGLSREAEFSDELFETGDVMYE
jgi:hypothetical protein